MTSTFLFLLVIMSVSAWWLFRQGLMTKPWLETGPATGLIGAPIPTATIGLRVLLAVLGSLFALLISAYSMRMGMGDWRALPTPRILWPSTGMLIMSSVALQWAKTSARRGDMDGVKLSLAAGGVFAVAFLAIQLMAWRELSDAGYFLARNPASSFFYLITGLHGLHVLGGLIALARTTDKAWRDCDMAKVRLSVQLCTTYWHFLLFVWLILFTLLTGWVDDFAAICREVLT